MRGYEQSSSLRLGLFKPIFECLMIQYDVIYLVYNFQCGIVTFFISDKLCRKIVRYISFSNRAVLSNCTFNNDSPACIKINYATVNFSIYIKVKYNISLAYLFISLSIYLIIHPSFKFDTSRKDSPREGLNVNCKFLTEEDICVD